MGAIDVTVLTRALVELEERRIQVWIEHEQVCEHDDCPVEPRDIGCADAQELATEYERLLAQGRL